MKQSPVAIGFVLMFGAGTLFFIGNGLYEIAKNNNWGAGLVYLGIGVITGFCTGGLGSAGH